MGVPTEPIEVSERIVMNYYTAKRMLYGAAMSLQRHEADFGVLETDVQKRVMPGVMRPAPLLNASRHGDLSTLLRGSGSGPNSRGLLARARLAVRPRRRIPAPPPRLQRPARPTRRGSAGRASTPFVSARAVYCNCSAQTEKAEKTRVRE